MKSSSLLEIYGLSFAYEKGPRVLNEVSFEIAAGDFVALLGPNGCGKSTLLKLVSGVLPSERLKVDGQVRYREKDFFIEGPAFRARAIAYIGHDFRTEFPITAHEAVMLARTVAARGFAQHVSSKDYEAVEWAMQQCRCWDWRDRDLQSLSSGERQLVGLARGLAQGAKVLFLDESLSQMDLHHQGQIGRMLKELTREGWTVMLVSHDVNLACEWADMALLMKAGEKVAYGAVREMLTDDKIRTIYPDSDLFIGRHPRTGAPKVFFGNST